jgi:hypothetical protein
MNFGIVYLCRGIDIDHQDIIDFSVSLEKNLLALEPNYRYKIYIIFKGWEEKKHINPKYFFSNIKKKISFFDFSDDGFDLGTYFKVLKYVDEEYIYFFNSTSRIIDDNFFKFSINAMLDKKLGLLGWAGSFGTLRPSIKKIFFKLKINININKNFMNAIKNLLIDIIAFPYHLYLYKNFPKFPNPHVRSNAFLIKKDLYEEFSKISKYSETKIESCELESGKNGLTKFVQKKGYDVKVINSKNKIFDIRECDKSETWRTGDKQHVLVADNGTLSYEKMPISRKLFKEYSAWEEIKTNFIN